MSELHIDLAMNQIRIVNEKKLKARLFLCWRFFWVAMLFYICGALMGKAVRADAWANGKSIFKSLAPMLKAGTATIQLTRIPEWFAEKVRVGINKTDVKF